ncbi:MgtC/SapB family protein [Stutzerimonas kirkiae]|uniref:MgtC/SapB family protein n=1 Tax=Stutzerimonas kirkiae TaxID=2211392 RepID=UPI001038412B|nr:MgtC/SapB family protein [Stutzerimonas kirkiae]TBV07195.1 methyltransferase [Stutzerimonas kirkiae]
MLAVSPLSSEILLHLALAALIGTCIGLERQWRHRLTGMTTNSLVALGAAIFTSLSLLFPEEGSSTRVAAQVVSGIGFLGAGVIIRDGFSVRGLSTAATLWCSAAVGTLAGAGYSLLAVQVGGLIVLTNLVLHPLANLINRHTLHATQEEQFYRVDLTCKTNDEARIRNLLLKGINHRKLRLQRLESHALDGSGLVEVSAVVFSLRREDELLEQLAGRFSLDPHISAAGWHAEHAPN